MLPGQENQPATPPVAGRIGPVSEGIPPHGLEETNGKSGVSEPRPRVLVVDDSEVVRTALKQLLDTNGYDVALAADGAEAIDQLQAQPADIVVLDLQMPGMDGFELLDRLHEQKSTLPVVLLSGLPAAAIQDRMAELRAERLPPLFLKPVDFDQFVTVLDLLLSGEMPDFGPA